MRGASECIECTYVRAYRILLLLLLVVTSQCSKQEGSNYKWVSKLSAKTSYTHFPASQLARYIAEAAAAAGVVHADVYILTLLVQMLQAVCTYVYAFG